MVRVYVFDAHHDRAAGGALTLLGHDDGAIANVELRAMVRDQDTKSESEDLAQPLCCGADISVWQFGDYCAGRARPIRQDG